MPRQPLPATVAEPDSARAQQLVLDMLPLTGPSGQEQPVMDYIRQRLVNAGLPPGRLRFDDAPCRSPRGGEVGNLVVKLPGTRPGSRSDPPRLLMAHVDTVPICVGSRPVVRGRWVVPADKTTGLGADDRAGAAIILSAALEILQHELPHPPLTFLWTVQEEVGLYGARYGRPELWGKPALAFNFDGGPTGKLTIGATGGYRMKIIVHGRASHAGVVPEKGISAIAIAALAIARLQREGWHGRIVKDGHHGTSNVGAIRGGNATNVVTPEVELAVEARSHEPAFRRQIVAAIGDAFRDAAREVRDDRGRPGRVKIEGRLDYESFAISSDQPCVVAARAAVEAAGGTPELCISNGGLDANWVTAHGIPTVTLGTGQRNGHTTTERLCLPEFHQACRIALRLATDTAPR